jgi:hypothetical protein
VYANEHEYDGGREQTLSIEMNRREEVYSIFLLSKPRKK